MKYLSIVALLVVVTGCAHVPLKRNTQRQVRTVAEIQQQQVMDNVAMFVSDPNAIPFYSMPDAGGAQVTLNSGADIGLQWNPTTLVSETLGLGGTGTLTENWTLKPVNDPDRLAMMKCVYQQVVCKSGSECFSCEEKLRTLFGDDYAFCDVPGCWFRRGCHRDVPKDCCFKAEYCGNWIWVDSQHREHLARVTLAILRIATADIASFNPPVEKIQVEETTTYGDGKTITAKFSLPTDRYENYRTRAREEQERQAEQKKNDQANFWDALKGAAEKTGDAGLMEKLQGFESQQTDIWQPSSSGALLPKSPPFDLPLDGATSSEGARAQQLQTDPLSSLRSQSLFPQ